MNLTVDEGLKFYELYVALSDFVNRKLKVSSEQFSDSRTFVSVSTETKITIRDAFVARPELIEEFIRDNPAKFSDDDLAVVATWKRAVAGDFFVFRYLKRYTVFLTDGSPNIAFGVLGLADPLEQLLGPSLPQLVSAVLLPFRGKIIYDGLLSIYDMPRNSEVKRTLNQKYKDAKASLGVIVSLEDHEATAPGSPKKTKRRSSKGTATKGGRSASGEARALIQMTDIFCSELLNEEYAELCRKLAMALARKRPSPLLRGQRNTWASGIVRTIGWVNFLDDPSQTPHMKLDFIDEAFGVAKSTGAAKSRAIRKMFQLSPLAPKWTLPSLLEDNPLVWMVEVNGLIMDMRSAPLELQEMALEQGLIPYIPTGRTE